jgi:nitrate/TMAO reductase-like tetraheme cytochrome c subunit
MNHGFVNATTCNACHNGQTFATGVVPKTKAANHITTAIDCVSCHTGFTTFAGGRMGSAEHVANGNTASCSGCHGGQAFQGVTPVAKPGNHVPTSGDCALCHSTSNFNVGAFATLWGMNHTGIAANCIQCHNGTSFGTSAPVVPINKIDTPSPGHVPTGADCSNCHNVVNTPIGGGKVASLWATIKKPQVHTAVLLTGYSAAVCYPCHGLTTPTYFGTLNQCGTNKGLQAGDHKKCTATNCASCHKGNETGGRFK